MGFPNHESEGQVFHNGVSKLDDSYLTEEQEPTWFAGTLMYGIKPFKDSPVSINFIRLATLHNKITSDDTNYTERFEANTILASQLSEFFPFKWLLEITAVFRKIPHTRLTIKTYRDRVCSYLGYIELYLTFRGLTLLDSTLIEINESLRVKKHIKMREVRNWKLRIIRVTPELKERWIKIRARAHQDVILSAVVKVMNTELAVIFCSKKEIFQVKQKCLGITKEFSSSPKSKHVKNHEVWARAICAKAVRSILPAYPSIPFPHLPKKTLKVIENKRWQLDQIIK